MAVRISASLASAPAGRLEQSLRDLERAGVDAIHFDLEDGSFVPVMTLGTKIISDLRPLTKLPFDVHLMRLNPEWILPELVAWGADRISVHYEACPYPRRVLRRIVDLGAQAGLAFNPGTPLPELGWLAPYLSFVLILTTEPEGPDCPFLPGILEKLQKGRREPALEEIEWVVDGGIDPENAALAVKAGAGSLVVGRALFKDGNLVDNLAALRGAG